MLLSILFTWSKILLLSILISLSDVELLSNNINLLVTFKLPSPLPIAVYSLVILMNSLSWIANTSAPIVSEPIIKYPGLALVIFTPSNDIW